MLHIESLTNDESEAGIYTWWLAEDRLYGDTAVAALFGLEPAQTIQGLPLNNYLERVHADDRPLLAALISKAVLDGLPFNAEYRVKNTDNRFEMVMAVGRCFRDTGGNPTLYSGIIYPVQRLF